MQVIDPRTVGANSRNLCVLCNGKPVQHNGQPVGAVWRVVTIGRKLVHLQARVHSNVYGDFIVPCTVKLDGSGSLQLAT